MRDKLQTTAAIRLKEHKRLACQWCTGCGKSGVVLKFLKQNPNINVLILVPETNNIQNWFDEFAKFNVSTFGVNVACYASLHKYQNTTWDLLVVDEAPHTNTELKVEYLSTIKAEYVLALGAYMSDEEMTTLKNIFGAFSVWTISLKTAIKYGILPEPTIYVIHMSIDDKDGKYAEICNKIEKAKTEFKLTYSKRAEVRMKRLGAERKRLLGVKKEAAIRKVCRALEAKSKRFLCFCSSIVQAERLGEERAFTSKTPASARILDKFNNHEIDSLYVVAKLIEGQNLNDIHCGVLGQVGGSNRISIQMIGRVMRSNKPVIYVPVFDNTKDEGFLHTVTDNIPKEYIKHYKF